MMKKRTITAVFCIAVLLVAFIVWLSVIPSNAVYITTAKVKVSSLVSDIDYSGTIEAEQNVPVTSDTGGRVLSVNAVLGQSVKKDDILFTVDSADIALQYKQVEANYEAAEANYEKISGGSVKESEMQLSQALLRAKNELRDAEAAYQAAEEQYQNDITIASAQSAYDMAKANYNRISLLVSLGEDTQYSLNTAKSQMDAAEAQLEIAKASAQTALNGAESRLKNAQAAYDNAQKDYNLTVNTLNPGTVKSAQAQRDAAKAAADLAKRKLDNASVKAPASGRIAMCNVSAGNMLSPQIPVMTIVSVGQMEMTLHVTESGIGQVNNGMSAQITLLGSGAVFKGTVVGAAAAIDAKTGLTDVKVSIDNPDGKLKAGMLANAKLVPSNENREIYVPAKAVLSADNNPYVFVIENDRIKKAPVTLGEKRYAYVAVKGLSADAQVVVEGNTRVHENSAFQVVKAVS